MTILANSNQPKSNDNDLITAVIDGIAVRVPKGTLAIRAAEMLGIEIPRFCDHPALSPVAACRMCLVEIEGMPKPQPSCAITLTEGMQVKTQNSSQVASSAQEGVMEFLLLNHPLDCPTCDKGGECPLQNQAMSNGRADSRFEGTKRNFQKAININAQVLLDRERCVSCARCTRFADEIAGDPSLELLERGAKQQVGVADDQPFESYYSGNTVQICPVGALTSAAYRFRARPFDLVSSESVCEHCASGCSLRTDSRRGKVLRRLAGDDSEVNEEWNCDKGRFAFRHLMQDRITTPLVREHGELRPASWPEAIRYAAEGLRNQRAAVLAGGRLTLEDAYAYSRFARVALGTNNVDFRNRTASSEEQDFLTNHVAGTGLGVTYQDLEDAQVVVVIGFEPEEESPIIMLRLRKAVRNKTLKVIAIDSANSLGFKKLNADLRLTKPGNESAAISELIKDLQDQNSIILVGERLASSHGAFSATVAVAEKVGARIGWVPRRAGERAAVDAGLLPNLLPAGRKVLEPRDREVVASAWGVSVEHIPTKPGLTQLEIISSAVQGEIDAIVTAGVDINDVANHAAFAAALNKTFVVSLENRASSVIEFADVVLPVGAITERAGTFVDWEGRLRTFDAVMQESLALTDARVLHLIAIELGHTFKDDAKVTSLRSSYSSLGAVSKPGTMNLVAASTTKTGLVLAGWHHLLDNGSLQAGEPHLAATARAVVAKVSSETAQANGLISGNRVIVRSKLGAITLPLEISEVAPETIWLPLNSEGSSVAMQLQIDIGAEVSVSDGGSI
jgi:NADH-quinone oxidoreductase subunit G